MISELADYEFEYDESIYLKYLFYALSEEQLNNNLFPLSQKNEGFETFIDTS